jgi:hypothetical protein
MRVLLFSHLIASLALCLHACAPLPTVGFGVRSIWRAREQQNGRTIDLLAGVNIGWAGNRRHTDPITPADAAPAAALGLDALEAPCAELVFCRWEDDQRRAALAREGVTESAIESEPPTGVFR